MEQPTLTFDHTKDCLYEAMGISKDDVKAYNHKRAILMQRMFTEELAHSQIAEIISKEFTQQELIISSAIHMMETMESISEHPLGGIVMALSDIFKDLKKMQSEDKEEDSESAPKEKTEE